MMKNIPLFPNAKLYAFNSAFGSIAKQLEDLGYIVEDAETALTHSTTRLGTYVNYFHIDLRQFGNFGVYDDLPKHLHGSTIILFECVVRGENLVIQSSNSIYSQKSKLWIDGQKPYYNTNCLFGDKTSNLFRQTKISQNKQIFTSYFAYGNFSKKTLVEDTKTGKWYIETYDGYTTSREYISDFLDLLE